MSPPLSIHLRSGQGRHHLSLVFGHCCDRESLADIFDERCAPSTVNRRLVALRTPFG